MQSPIREPSEEERRAREIIVLKRVALFYAKLHQTSLAKAREAIGSSVKEAVDEVAFEGTSQGGRDALEDLLELNRKYKIERRKSLYVVRRAVCPVKLAPQMYAALNETQGGVIPDDAELNAPLTKESQKEPITPKLEIKVETVITDKAYLLNIDEDADISLEYCFALGRTGREAVRRSNNSAPFASIEMEESNWNPIKIRGLDSLVSLAIQERTPKAIRAVIVYELEYKDRLLKD